MPEDRCAHAPTKGEFTGVRTFGRQVTQVAVTNYVMAAAILQEKPPVALGGDDANGPASIVSKADSMSVLKDSFA